MKLLSRIRDSLNITKIQIQLVFATDEYERYELLEKLHSCYPSYCEKTMKKAMSKFFQSEADQLVALLQSCTKRNTPLDNMDLALIKSNKTQQG